MTLMNDSSSLSWKAGIVISLVNSFWIRRLVILLFTRNVIVGVTRSTNHLTSIIVCHFVAGC